VNFDPYNELMAQAGEMTSRLTEYYRAHLNCRAGCSGCCQHHLSVFPVEAAGISAAIQALPDETQRRLKRQATETIERESQSKAVACPMLINDKCAIYEARPVICRTQGLPLLYETEDGEQVVDFCPLNFTAEHATDELDEARLVPLETLNLRLAAVNLHFCRAQGVGDEASFRRVRMSDIILRQDKV
jgi:Fe-S-cluster containining protein